MHLAIKVALLAGGLVTVPSAAAILSTAPLTSSSAPKAKRIDMSFQDGRAFAASVEDGAYKFDAPIALAQAMGRPWGSPGIGILPAQFGPPPVPGAPGLSGPPGPFGPGPLPGPPPSPRSVCEEEVNRLMAVTAYLKSKMHLQAEQKAAWQKIEQAAEPHVEKIRDLCGQLPSQSSPPPSVLEVVDFAAKHMSARAELLRAVHAPLQALYEALTPDQRALLVIAPPAFPPMPPLPPGLPMMPPHTPERL